MLFVEADSELILEGEASDLDYILLSDGERQLREIQPGAKSGKGKNSCVFRACHPEGGADVIVKFCRFPDGVNAEEEVRRRRRFFREIAALKRAGEANLGMFLIRLYEDGIHEIGRRKFAYYVMEEARYDLTQYLATTSLTLQQKMLLCTSLLKDLMALHEIGIYHRDLKPDNILFVDDQWKIGDLGFIASREEDEDIDAPRERIGPTGSMSPEATNKAFANLDSQEFAYDCTIDEISDIYQLGSLFWYILQGNLPTGQLAREDFRIGNDNIYTRLLVPMLQHGKQRRPTLASVDQIFHGLERDLSL